MSDFPFSIPRRGDADVVNGVSYSGDTLTLTRAEGSDLTTTIATGDPVTGVSYSGDTLSLERATGADLTTTIATSDPTKIENGTSKMEIENSAGACVFTPAGLTARKTTFAADGNIATNGGTPGDGGYGLNVIGDQQIRRVTGNGSIELKLNNAGLGNGSGGGLLLQSDQASFNNTATIDTWKSGVSSNCPVIIKTMGTERMKFNHPNSGVTNITMASDLDVTGGIICSGNIVSASASNAARSDFGFTSIGNVGYANYAGFSHTSMAGTTGNYALLQNSTGETFINAATGKPINFLINNTIRAMKILSTGEVGINNITPSEILDVGGNIKLTGNILGNGVEIATTSGACVFTPNGNAALATTFFADGKFNVNQQIRFNDLKGIGHAIDFLGLPNIQVGSAYAFANTNVGQTFERLMSYSKIGNMLNINGHFVFKPTATTGTAYMNYYDIGLAGGIDNKVYIISDLGNGIFTSITADAPNSRLLFNFTVGSSAVNVTQVATLKFFCGLSFRGSYG